MRPEALIAAEMSPPANNNGPVPVAPASSVPAPTIQLPAALLGKCFVPYARNGSPTLHGHPIAVNAQTAAPDNALLLSPSLIDLALRVLKTEMSKPSEPQTLRVTALCTPKLDSALAVDAAVRYLAHHFKADVLVLDADDLAAAEHGVLGADFSSALWSLYARHYEISDELKAMSAVEKDTKSAQDELAKKEEALEQRKRALSHYVDENAVAEKTEDDAACRTSDEADAGESTQESARGTAEDQQTADDTEPHDAESLRDTEHDPEHERSAAPQAHASEEPPVEDDELAGLKQDVVDAERSANDARSKADSSAKALADLKAEHARSADARASAYTTSLAWLRAFLRAGGSSRRRFLYLRNFGASSYVFLPLLHPLLRAISECGLPVTVLAGYSRVPIMQWTDTDADENAKRVTTKHTAYLTALESRPALLAYVKRKCTPEWRQSADNAGRATGLADLFSRAVIERYFVRKLARGSAETLRVGEDAKFEFTGALAVALVAEPATVHREFPTRLVLARHVRSLSKELSDDYKKTWAGEVETNVVKWLEMLSEKAPDAKASVRRLSEIMYKDAAMSTLAAGIAPWLSAKDALTTADVFAAVEKWDVAQAELLASLALERDGSLKKADSAPSVAEQVKNAKDLDEYEKRLLGAIIDPATITTTYEDVCMQPHIIDTLRSVVSLPLLYADAYSTGILGRESMAGVLLYGPPGTGKTMVCRALAKESGANMLQIQASTIRSMWHSEDEKLIHATFTLARRLGPCVIFIDEIEALFGSRARSGHIHRSTLTEFLQEMDGLKSASENRTNKIVIVGATNRPQDLDEAVLRRLPRRVLVDLPGTSEREKIIKHYLTGEKTDETVDIAALAARTPHYSGSDLKHVVFSAALSAFKDTVPDLWAPPARTNGEKSRPLPPRVIGSHHFDKALREVVASAKTHLDSIAELRNWGGSTGV